MTVAAKLAKPIQISQEAAYDIVNSFTSDIQQYEFPALKVVSGKSDIHGLIHVIFPPIGDALLLPFASQSDLI